MYKDSNQLLLQSVGKQMSLLLGSIRACSCSSSSACLIQCTIICFQFSRALGRSSFHHLPIFPAWNRRLATTLLASVLWAARKLCQTQHCLRNSTRLCLAPVLICDWWYHPVWENKACSTSGLEIRFQWVTPACFMPVSGLVACTARLLAWVQSSCLRIDTLKRHLPKGYDHSSIPCQPVERNMPILNAI